MPFEDLINKDLLLNFSAKRKAHKFAAMKQNPDSCSFRPPLCNKKNFTF